MSPMSPIAWMFLRKAVRRLAPKRATGVYITSHGITFGFRTNRTKFPPNFVPFDMTVDEFRRRFLLQPGLADEMREMFTEPPRRGA